MAYRTMAGLGTTLNQRRLLHHRDIAADRLVLRDVVGCQPLFEHPVCFFSPWSKQLFFGILVFFIAAGAVLGSVTIAVNSGQIQPSITKPIDLILQSLKQPFSYNDGLALIFQASGNLLRGKNPYASPNVVAAMDQYRGATKYLTPRMEGQFKDDFPYPSQRQIDQVWNEAQANASIVPAEFESRLNYPAGSFLLGVPFVALGLSDYRWVAPIFTFIALAFAFWRMNRRSRFFFALVLTASLEFLTSLLGGRLLCWSSRSCW